MRLRCAHKITLHASLPFYNRSRVSLSTERPHQLNHVGTARHSFSFKQTVRSQVRHDYELRLRHGSHETNIKIGTKRVVGVYYLRFIFLVSSSASLPGRTRLVTRT
jgi:hypothetical protein